MLPTEVLEDIKYIFVNDHYVIIYLGKPNLFMRCQALSVCFAYLLTNYYCLKRNDYIQSVMF